MLVVYPGKAYAILHCKSSAYSWDWKSRPKVATPGLSPMPSYEELSFGDRIAILGRIGQVRCLIPCYGRRWLEDCGG